MSGLTEGKSMPALYHAVQMRTDDKEVQDLLWIFAQRRRAAGAESNAAEIEKALRLAGFRPPDGHAIAGVLGAPAGNQGPTHQVERAAALEDLKTAQVNRRGAGRTLAMVKEMQVHKGVVVVVHIPPMVDYLRDMIRGIHGDQAAHDVTVRMISDINSARDLQAFPGPIYVDHAFWDSRSGHVLCEVAMVRDLVNSRMPQGKWPAG